jgi:hypothetical protein
MFSSVSQVNELEKSSHDIEQFRSHLMAQNMPFPNNGKTVHSSSSPPLPPRTINNTVSDGVINQGDSTMRNYIAAGGTDSSLNPVYNNYGNGHFNPQNQGTIYNARLVNNGGHSYYGNVYQTPEPTPQQVNAAEEAEAARMRVDLEKNLPNYDMVARGNMQSNIALTLLKHGEDNKSAAHLRQSLVSYENLFRHADFSQEPVILAQNKRNFGLAQLKLGMLEENPEHVRSSIRVFDTIGQDLERYTTPLVYSLQMLLNPRAVAAHTQARSLIAELKFFSGWSNIVRGLLGDSIPHYEAGLGILSHVGASYVKNPYSQKKILIDNVMSSAHMGIALSRNDAPTLTRNARMWHLNQAISLHNNNKNMLQGNAIVEGFTEQEKIFHLIAAKHQLGVGLVEAGIRMHDSQKLREGLFELDQTSANFNSQQSPYLGAQTDAYRGRALLALYRLESKPHLPALLKQK